MPWKMTLEVVDCDAMSTFLAGAKIELGTTELGFTNASGRFEATLDDFNTLPIFKISKADYVKSNFRFDKTIDSGTTRQVCLRNIPTIPDGHDPNVPGESGGEEFDAGGCFIVTATTGSAESVEVNSLRQLRDRVSASSRLGAQLIDVIYGEYYQFSPGIATELQQNAIARETVLQIVVRPLLAWYTLAGTLALEQADQKAADQAVQDVLNACPRYLWGRTIITVLEAMRAGEALPTNTPPLLLDLVPRITHLQFASWAILDPLIRAWRSATDDLDVVNEVAQWLATAPLEVLAPPSDPEILERELGVLADFLDFRPLARQQLGERLTAAWPDVVSALGQAGFVSQAPGKK